MAGTSEFFVSSAHTNSKPSPRLTWVNKKWFHQLTMAAVIVFLANTATVAWAKPISPQCQDFQGDPPAWLYSGELTGADELVLIDSLYSKAYTYTLNGKRLQEISGLKSGSLQIERPSWIRKLGDDSYLLEDEDGRIVQLDSQLNPEKVFVDLLGIQNSEGLTIGSIWGWQVSSDGTHVFAFGDVKDRSDQWSSAFMLIPVRAPGMFKVVHSVDLGDPIRNLFLLGSSYIAASGSDFYFILTAKENFAIYKVSSPSGAKTKVASLPTEKPLQLPEKRGATNVSELFTALEQANLPVGIYSSRPGSVFVLLRSARGQGKTHWALARLDAVNQRLVDAQSLNIKANHVVAIAGEDSWIVVTKGPVQSLGQQKVLSICTITSDQF